MAKGQSSLRGRSAEQIAIRWGDVDWRARTVHIRQSAPGGGEIASTKSGTSPRLLPSWIGPSMAAFAISGIASWAPIDSIADPAMNPIRFVCGRR